MIKTQYLIPNWQLSEFYKTLCSLSISYNFEYPYGTSGSMVPIMLCIEDNTEAFLAKIALDKYALNESQKKILLKFEMNSHYGAFNRL